MILKRISINDLHLNVLVAPSRNTLLHFHAGRQMEAENFDLTTLFGHVKQYFKS